ncbi:hypothetical protein [Thiothrix lacustris]|uniref:hypothetical protein n=1 Tax=Thiothrix lacustris TaxID=525917 RepID=UPI0027E45BAD|nr:hypothetical protein [Thiothrix lacustris]WMP17078.1 hypothetical protein RCS87_17100 [Thiothrix lacustris]
MKLNSLKALGLAVLLMTGGNAVADEVWNTNVGRIVYADEIGPTAVFAYGPAEDPGVIYILGLAKVYENRGTYEGYWAENKAKVECTTERPGIFGKMTKYWGRYQIKFLDKGFPARWEATWSYCDGAAESVKIEATPAVGEAVAAPAPAKK